MTLCQSPTPNHIPVTYWTMFPLASRNFWKCDAAIVKVAVLMFGWNDNFTADFRSQSITTRTECVASSIRPNGDTEPSVSPGVT